MRQLGKLYLIPTLLGNSNPEDVLSGNVKYCIENVNYFIAENEKTARRFIKLITPEKSQQQLNISVLNKHTTDDEKPSFLNPCFEGISVGILSEAGCPGIADPGAEIVRIAHQKNIQVVPLVGPSSILLAMMASGMNGQSFAFNGYLPIEKDERKKAIKHYERKAKEEQQSQIFIETPYRNDNLLAELTTTLRPSTLLCVACDISLPSETIKTQAIASWKKTEFSFQKRPAIFIIG